MFTPKDLQEISFNKVRRGGYDMQSVDAVLEPLCQDYTKLYKENSVLKSKLKILVEKLEEYRSEEISVKQALIAAQQASEAIIAEAQRKAAGILNDAESTASVQQQEAVLNQQILQEQQRLAQAKAEAVAFIDALEQDIHKHLGLVNALKTRVPAEAPAPAAPAPVAAPAAATPEVGDELEDMDLISAISGAVQEIAGAPKAADVHFDDLQFGREYSFNK